jgi:hypothetical protein
MRVLIVLEFPGFLLIPRTDWLHLVMVFGLCFGGS